MKCAYQGMLSLTSHDALQNTNAERKSKQTQRENNFHAIQWGLRNKRAEFFPPFSLFSTLEMFMKTNKTFKEKIIMVQIRIHR